MSKALSSCFCHLIGNIPLGIQKSQSVNNSRLHWTPRHQARICLWALDREKSSLHASESVDNALCSLSRPYRIIFTMSETRNFVHYPVIAIICKKNNANSPFVDVCLLSHIFQFFFCLRRLLDLYRFIIAKFRWPHANIQAFRESYSTAK